MNMNKIINTILTLFVLAGTLSCQKEEILNNKPPIANAGDNQIIHFEESTFGEMQLNGSGTDADGIVVGYLWSQVEGPNKAKILNEGSASTVVSELINGRYVFQLMVVDNDGATGIDTIGVTVIAPTERTLVLQPHNNKNEVIIWGNSSGMDQTDNNSIELAAGWWTNQGIDIGIRSAFAFDFSSIPAGAKIISAKLSLFSHLNPLNGDQTHANSGGSNAMYIRRNTAAWNAQEVKWTNQPATTAEHQVIIPHTNQSFLDLIDIDVKDLVNDMLANGNFGFNIRLQNESVYNIRNFYSSKSADNTKHPKLVINFLSK